MRVQTQSYRPIFSQPETKITADSLVNGDSFTYDISSTIVRLEHVPRNLYVLYERALCFFIDETRENLRNFIKMVVSVKTVILYWNDPEIQESCSFTLFTVINKTVLNFRHFSIGIVNWYIEERRLQFPTPPSTIWTTRRRGESERGSHIRLFWEIKSSGMIHYGHSVLVNFSTFLNIAHQWPKFLKHQKLEYWWTFRPNPSRLFSAVKFRFPSKLRPIQTVHPE